MSYVVPTQGDAPLLAGFQASPALDLSPADPIRRSALQLISDLGRSARVLEQLGLAAHAPRLHGIARLVAAECCALALDDQPHLASPAPASVTGG